MLRPHSPPTWTRHLLEPLPPSGGYAPHTQNSPRPKNPPRSHLLKTEHSCYTQSEVCLSQRFQCVQSFPGGIRLIYLIPSATRRGISTKNFYFFNPEINPGCFLTSPTNFLWGDFPWSRYKGSISEVFTIN
jgi:hypothetical protein